ncbi:MAG: 6-pyruvoyl tetrahydropterin synthase family protein, partial [Fuerstiella sp.]|nr:6-pyruvoyl tetrahydropterin synthase family protein [Fuerstiella sp.]
MTESFEARVTKDSLVFSAAHFITFNGNICERLHGHNWRVDVGISGQLDENGYVFDFIALRDACQKLVSDLDHKVLLPDRHEQISVEGHSDGREIIARFGDRRWIFPVADCAILPVRNTTAELIARWIGSRLREDLGLDSKAGLTDLRLSVEENFGQWATVRMPLGNDGITPSG